MYNTRGRYTLMAIFAVTGLVCLIYKQYQPAAIAALLLCFVIWSHFKNSSVLLASKSFANGDYEKAGRILKDVPNPDRLARNRRGYYEFMMGNIALKNKDYEQAEYHFQIASRFPLGGQSDKSYVLIHLANLALRKKDKARTQAYVEKAKELARTERAKEIVGQIEKEVNNL